MGLGIYSLMHNGLWAVSCAPHLHSTQWRWKGNTQKARKRAGTTASYGTTCEDCHLVFPTECWADQRGNHNHIWAVVCLHARFSNQGRKKYIHPFLNKNKQGIYSLTTAINTNFWFMVLLASRFNCKSACVSINLCFFFEIGFLYMKHSVWKNLGSLKNSKKNNAKAPTWIQHARSRWNRCKPWI